MTKPRLRVQEWVLIVFFVYLAALPLFVRGVPLVTKFAWQPLLLALVVSGFLIALSRLETGRLAKHVRIIRRWMPLLLTYAALRETEFFVSRRYDVQRQLAWVRWDWMTLDVFRLRSAIEVLGPLLPFYLDICYLLVFAVSAYCVAALEAEGERVSVERRVEKFWTVYLIGTLSAFALFPYFPTLPPGLAFADIATPSFETWARKLNQTVLRASTEANAFPSASVASAFSAAFAMLLAMPKRKLHGWLLLGYAASVSVAAVYGRYHYLMDALAGFGLSLLAGAVAIMWRMRNGREERIRR